MSNDINESVKGIFDVLFPQEQKMSRCAEQKEKDDGVEALLNTLLTVVGTNGDIGPHRRAAALHMLRLAMAQERPAKPVYRGDPRG